MITKGGTSVVPHQNWRGAFARGTFASGTRAGQSSDCATYPPSNGCLPISWPGWATTAWHDDAGKQPTTGYAHYWFGSQAVGMRDASGQMYMRNRYYDPQTGQFTQPDPIGLAGGLNVYGFAAGDPVGNYDPSGLCAFGIGSDAFHGRCGDALGAGDAQSHEPKRNGRCEVARVLSNHIRALRTDPLIFATFGDLRDYPKGFDFKVENRDELFEVNGQWLAADEFGNFAAGYAGPHAFGRAGHGVMILGGRDFARQAVSNEKSDDSESRPMIDGGARRAALEQANDGSFVQFNNGGYQKSYIEPLTSRAGATKSDKAQRRAIQCIPPFQGKT